MRRGKYRAPVSGFIPHITQLKERYRTDREVTVDTKENRFFCQLCEGFTLIETLIVVAIMAVLSSMLLTYNNSSSSRIGLYAEQATVAGALDRAKSLALEKWKGSAASACAFGVHFSKADGSYFLYQSVPRSSPPNPCSDPDRSYVSGDVIVQQLKLSGSVEFLVVPDNVYFVPPYLTTHGTGSISLRTKGKTDTASISVSAGGAVTIN